MLVITKFLNDFSVCSFLSIEEKIIDIDCDDKLSFRDEILCVMILMC